MIVEDSKKHPGLGPRAIGIVVEPAEVAVVEDAVLGVAGRPVGVKGISRKPAGGDTGEDGELAKVWFGPLTKSVSESLSAGGAGRRGVRFETGS